MEQYKSDLLMHKTKNSKDCLGFLGSGKKEANVHENRVGEVENSLGKDLNN